MCEQIFIIWDGFAHLIPLLVVWCNLQVSVMAVLCVRCYSGINRKTAVTVHSQLLLLLFFLSSVWLKCVAIGAFTATTDFCTFVCLVRAWCGKWKNKKNPMASYCGVKRLMGVEPVKKAYCHEAWACVAKFTVAVFNRMCAPSVLAYCLYDHVL